MTKFWTKALKICGPSAIAGLLIYTIYPLILNPEILKGLTSNERFVVISTVGVLTFLISYLLIGHAIKSAKPAPPVEGSKNKIKIINSKVNGPVAGGNQTNIGSPHD